MSNPSKPFHPLSTIFPLLEGPVFTDLVADIKGQGLREDIWLYQDQILDGRNRWRACTEAGITPRFRQYTGDDPVGFVVSLNLHRRHLSESQRGMVAAQIATKKVGKPNRANWPDISNKDAAEKLNVSEKSIKRAKQVRREGTPALIQKVEEGTVRVSTAADIATLPPAEQNDLIAKGEKEILAAAKDIRAKKATSRRAERIDRLQQQSGHNKPLDTQRKYPVIYADPPWSYEHSASDSRHLDNQYPTLSLADIEAFPVAQLATRDSVVFMWVTSPKLTEGLQVLDAWGFTYKTCAVWDKEIIGMGYWFRQQSELLLVGTRGHMPPPAPSMRPSSVIRSPRTRHSEKPVAVYQLIENMYPELPKIELFARCQRAGWEAFGNDAA